jgi:hypothetical protein
MDTTQTLHIQSRVINRLQTRLIQSTRIHFQLRRHGLASSSSEKLAEDRNEQRRRTIDRLFLLEISTSLEEIYYDTILSSQILLLDHTI